MATVRQRIDRMFEAWGSLVIRRRGWALFLMVCLSAAFIAPLPTIRLETSNDSYFHPNDPTLHNFQAFREQFSREDRIIVAITPETAFERAFLERLKAFHEALEARVPYLSKVTSLVNVRHIRGEGDTLIVEKLLEHVPESEAGMAVLKARVLGSHLYRNYLISEDGRTLAVLVEALAFSPGPDAGALPEGFDSGGFERTAPRAGAPREAPVPLTEAESLAVLNAVREVVAEFDSPAFPLHLGGGPSFEAFFKEAMTRDLALFLSLAFLTIGLFLVLLFRSLYGLVLPMAVVVLSLLATVGMMAAFGVPFTLPTTILPSFLLAVGVGDSVHLLALVFRYARTEAANQADAAGATAVRDRAIVHALTHSGLPIVMTSLTTAAGLFAFSTSGMAPIAHLGIFAGLGVLIALLYTLVLLPALMAMLPLRPGGGPEPEGLHAVMDRLLAGIAAFAIRRAVGVVAVGAVIVAVSIVGLFSLRFTVNFLAWLPPDLDVRRNTELIDRSLKGSIPLELVIDTGQEDGLTQPRVLRAMDDLGRFAENYRDARGWPLVGKASSVVEVVKETNQALNGNRASFYALPSERDLIAQELLLFENSGGEDLEQLVDRAMSKARLTLVAPFHDAAVYVGLVAHITKKARELFDPGVRIVVTGTMNLFTQMLHRMMLSMAESYVIAAVVIGAMMMLLIGSVRLGLLSMAVNIAPILVTLGGVMGYTGIRLDIATLLLGSIALGLSVDDTIHFFHNFRRYYGEQPDLNRAVRETLLTSGRAMLFTTLVLVCGFWVFMFATLRNNFNFGLLTGVTLIIALAADFLLAPALLSLIARTETGRRVFARWCETASAASGA